MESVKLGAVTFIQSVQIWSSIKILTSLKPQKVKTTDAS